MQPRGLLMLRMLEVQFPILTTCGLLIKRVQPQILKLIDQSMRNYGAECGAVLNEQQAHIVPFPAVQVGEGGAEAMVDGVISSPIWMTGKLKGVE